MAVLRVGQSAGLEHQHGSATVAQRSAVKALAPPLGRRAIMFPATRWRGRSDADHRVRRGAMPPLGWPPAIETRKQKAPGRSVRERKHSSGSLLRHDCVPRIAIVRSAAPGRSLAWHSDRAATSGRATLMSPTRSRDARRLVGGSDRAGRVPRGPWARGQQCRAPARRRERASVLHRQRFGIGAAVTAAPPRPKGQPTRGSVSLLL